MYPFIFYQIPQPLRGWAAWVAVYEVQDMDFEIWFLGVSREGEVSACGCVQISVFDISPMFLESVYESSLGLAYILIFADVACETIN